MGTFIDQPGILLHRFHRVHRRAIHTELAAAGLEEVGHPLLLALLKSYRHGEGDCCHCTNGEELPPDDRGGQGMLADRLHVSPAAVATSLKSLERGGFIRRERLEQDARRNRILLTEKGRNAVAGCEDCFRRVEGRMLIGFSQEEKEQLVGLWQRMIRNLEEGAEGPSAPGKGDTKIAETVFETPGGV